LNREDLRRGVLPGVIATYLYLAYVGPEMQDTVGALFSAGALVSFILLVISGIIIGMLYTGLFLNYVKLGNPLLTIVVGGLLYGLIWWILGDNLIIPAIAGEELLQLPVDASFFGHIIYGHALAFIVVLRDLVLRAASK